jgi:hypothetical protein
MTVLTFTFVSDLFFKVFPEKKINYLYGYRTSSSMKNCQSGIWQNKFSANLIGYQCWSFYFFHMFWVQNIEATNWLIGFLC